MALLNTGMAALHLNEAGANATMIAPSVPNMVMRSLRISALEHTCSHCGKCHQHIQRYGCKRCGYAWYCSVACQTAASSEHTQACEPPPAWFKRVQLPPPSWFERITLSDVDEDKYIKAMAIAQSDSYQVTHPPTKP
jgi:hypothetical protein